MRTLEQRLKHPPDRLDAFVNNVVDALTHLDATTSLAYEIDGYSVYHVNGDTNHLLRPVRANLYIRDSASFRAEADSICGRLESLFGSGDNSYASAIDRVIYTAAQACYCFFDSDKGEGTKNASRKAAGTVFARLISNLFHAAGIDNQKLSFSLPTQARPYVYKIDIVANKSKIESARNRLSSNDLLFGCMTTTKDRISKIFAENIILEKCFGQTARLGAIALHDVQRVKASGISWTFSQNLFLLQWEHLSALNGLYYLDIPKPALGPLFVDKVFPLHKLVLNFPVRAQ